MSNEILLSAETIIERLQLRPLPREGGFYCETYRSEHVVPSVDDPAVSRSAGTAIYYLLTPDTCSRMHRLAGDEVYHFYVGDPVEMLLLEESGSGRTVVLGSDLAAGHLCQFVVPRGAWQGSRLVDGGQLALMGTTMAPGFDLNDFELGDPEALVRGFPRFADLIGRLSASGS